MLNVVKDPAVRAARFRRISRYALAVAWGLTFFAVVAIAGTAYGYYIYNIEVRGYVIAVTLVFFSAPPIAAFWIYEMCISTAYKHSNRALRIQNSVANAQIEELKYFACASDCSTCRKAVVNRRADALMAVWDTDRKPVDDGS